MFVKVDFYASPKKRVFQLTGPKLSLLSFLQCFLILIPNKSQKCQGMACER